MRMVIHAHGVHVHVHVHVHVYRVPRKRRTTTHICICQGWVGAYGHALRHRRCARLTHAAVDLTEDQGEAEAHLGHIGLQPPTHGVAAVEAALEPAAVLIAPEAAPVC